MMNRAQAAQALSPGFDPYAGHADTGSIFSAIGNAVSSAAKGIGKGASFAYNKAIKPTVQKGLPIVQTVLKNTGPFGMVASGALGAMKAGLSGKNLENIAWAAAEGAAPSGIDKAVGAAHAIRNGSNVLKTAINTGVSHFMAGTPEHLGFETAIATLKKTGSKVALGVARRNLPTEGAKRAFDSAIGTVSQVVSKNPASLAQRAGSAFVPDLSKAKGKLSPHAPNLQHAIDSIRRNPTLAAQNPLVLANKLGTTQQTVLQAVRMASTNRLLPWRSLSPSAMRFVRKWAPNAPVQALGHGTRDTAGLDESGTKYIVEKGDSPFKISLKLTGNGNRWVELKPLNADKKPSITQNVWVGEVLNIPPSWQKPKASASPGPAVASQPIPVAPSAPVVKTPVSISVAPGILQAKSIMVAWSKTDGVNQAGVSNYGSTAADLSTDFGSRDSMELMSFQNWANKTGLAKPALVVDGKLGPKSLAVLQQWAESRAAQAAPAAPVASLPLPPSVTTLPEILIEASAPVKVGPSAPVVSAPVASAPAVTPAIVPVASPAAPIAATPAPSSPAQAIPAVASPAAPATTQTVAAQTPVSGSKMAPALAGAAIGGVTFGLPGAIIGAVAGAAMA